MQPKERRETGEQDLFRSRLDQIIDLQHALVRLARTIDWLWLLKTPKRAEILEISAYPPYPCRHDHISFRPRFAARLPLS